MHTRYCLWEFCLIGFLKKLNSNRLGFVLPIEVLAYKVADGIILSLRVVHKDLKKFDSSRPRWTKGLVFILC